MATGDTILALDYNAIREKVISVMGAGYYQRGYGQQITSNESAPGHTITQEVWSDLRLDLVNILLHQTGSQPNVVVPVQGHVIRYGEEYPVTSYDTLIEQAIIDRFQIAPSRSLISAKESETHTGEWSDRAYCTATVTFSTSDEARWFFNAGGKIRFYSALTAETTTPTNVAWSNLLNSLGLVQFGAATPTETTYYELTDEYQVVTKYSSSGIYSYEGSSYIQISAKCNVPDNELGTATTIMFAIEWVNGSDGLYGIYGIYGPYGPYGGSPVTGTLLLSIDELKATGPIYPSGNVTITSPLYEMTSIVAE